MAGSFDHLSNSTSGRESPRSSGSESAAEAVRARRQSSYSTQNAEHIPDSEEEETTTDDDDNTEDYEHNADRVEVYSNDKDKYAHENTQVQPLRPSTHTLTRMDPSFRPPSSLSSQTLMRYRTPMAGSILSVTPGVPGGLGSSMLNNLIAPSGGAVPPTQPMPAYTTPSAFGGEPIIHSPLTVPPSSSESLSASTFMPGAPYPQPHPYTHQQPISSPLSVSAQTESSRLRSLSDGLNLIHGRNSLPHNTIPLPPQARYIRQYVPRSPLDSSVPSGSNGGNGGSGGGGPSPVERALENVQAHIAALSERVEMLEAITNAHGLSSSMNSGVGGSAGRNASLSSSSLMMMNSLLFGSSINSNHVWDPTQIGLWSNLVGPLSRVVDSLRSVAAFLVFVPIEETHLVSQARSDRDPRYRSYPYARRRYSSPSLSILLIIRRLILDVSFIFAFLGLVRFVWKRTGLRRKFIYSLVGMVWRSILGGERKARVMVDRGV